MRRDSELRVAPAQSTVRDVFAQVRRRGRRTGAVILIDNEGRLEGLFTDSDLARLFEQRRDDVLDRPISEVMTRNPLTVREGSYVAEAIELLRRHRIRELPVLDGAGRPIGLLDITDVLGFLPAEEVELLNQVA